MLTYAEACGEEGRRQLLRHQLRIDELKRSHWGCGVSFPRSCFFRQNVQDLEMYSVLAGTADATMCASIFLIFFLFASMFFLVVFVCQ